MRAQHGTVEAIERLVQSGDVQSGFKRLKQLGLLEWTIEAAVMKFPTEFTRNARQCAEWRLQQVQPKPEGLPNRRKEVAVKIRPREQTG
jgi:hypothetical protein